MASLTTDLKQALKLMVRHPGFAAMVILMIALGIAGNAAVFRVFDGLFLRPLPFAAPGELVDLDETAPAWNLEYTGMAYPDFVEWRRANETFAGMAVFSSFGFNTAADGEAVFSTVVQASHDLPGVLRIEPVMGRFYSAEEDVPDGPKVALVSGTYWKDRLGGRSDAVGSTLRLDGESYEVIGVFPDVAKRITNADLWVPLGLDENDETGWYLRGIGRLQPGVTEEQATADLTRVHKAMIERRDVNEFTSPVLQSITERYLGQFRLGAAALLVATALLLLIACANIAALMLARSLDRSREYGVRMAIGADRGRLTRQLLVESLVLGIIGSGLGTVLGYVGSDLIVGSVAAQFPAFVIFDLNPRFMAFIVLVTLAATAAFALLPSLSATGTSPSRVLGSANTRMSDSRGRLRRMNLLVAGEVALALLLLIAGGLFVRDVNRVLDVDPGFDVENLLSYGFNLPEASFETPEQRSAFLEEHLEHVRALPGVVNASLASGLPLTGHWGMPLRAEGAEPLAPGEADPIVLNRIVADDYFETMGVEFVAGRPFAPGEGGESGVIIVNETFAMTFFPSGDDPIGRRVRGTWPDAAPMTIVGVTRDVKHYGLDQAMRPGVYQPVSQFPLGNAFVVVRTAVPPTSLIPVARDLMRDANDEIGLYSVATMAQRFDRALWARRASSWLTATFSAVAFVLAVAGIYGVISHSIRRRRNEICIRMALGASNARVLAEVLKHVMLVIGAGIAVGLVVMLIVARVLSSLVVATSVSDPLVYLGVTAALLAAAAVASFVPALGLVKLEPAGALRAD